MRANGPPDRDRLLHLLDYNQETGVFTWRNPTTPCVRVGQRAGTIQSGGYVQIKLDKVNYLAHRLAWLYIYGTWPTEQIDHKNRVRHDNRILNLRDCTRPENLQNTGTPCNNTSGVKGVDQRTRRDGERLWRARIGVKGRSRHLGYFPTFAEAVAKRRAVETEEFPLSPLQGMQLDQDTTFTINSIIGEPR